MLHASSTSSLAIRMSSISCLPLTKVVQVSETTLQLVSTYQPTLLTEFCTNTPPRISRKSTNLGGLPTLEINATKVLLIHLVNLSFLWKSSKECISSTFKISQKSFIKPRLMSSDPGLLKLSWFQTVSLISSNEKDLIRPNSSYPLINLKERYTISDRLMPVFFKGGTILFL